MTSVISLKKGKNRYTALSTRTCKLAVNREVVTVPNRLRIDKVVNEWAVG